MKLAKLRRRAAFALAAAMAWTMATTAAMADTPECLPRDPIGCSVSWLGLVRLVTAFSIIFEDECLTHDLCYRHGARTYGYEKAKCDDDFLAAMDGICRSEIRPIDFITLGLSRVSCNVMKRGMYAAVSRTEAAEDAYKDAAEGTCCRYDEYGVPLPECAV